MAMYFVFYISFMLKFYFRMASENPGFFWLDKSYTIGK